MTTIIKTENLWKTYGEGGLRQVDAVKGISLDIEKGAVTALGGPSGSGKTTVLSIVGLLTRPTRGNVYLEEQELSNLSEVFRTRIRREKIGFIFQAQYLIPQLTAFENVALPMLCTDMSRTEAEGLAREKLSEMGMGHRLDFRVAELSGGEQQRVSIARALIGSPDILIADEPSSSIDEELTLELLDIIRSMVDNEGLTAVVASHDPIVLKWADHLFQMRNGELERKHD
ncbi:MAG: ABC transporter ATP-binding protein [Candidatus Hodarchaeota archaeon]